MTRDVLLGSLSHVWMLFIHSYWRWISYGHLLQFVIFVGREVNRPMLIYQIMSEFIAWRSTPSEQVVVDTLTNQSTITFYVLLSTTLIKRKHSMSPSTTNLRWQPGERYVYVEEGDQWRVVILLKFVIECLDTINRSATDGEADAAINLLGSSARKKFLWYTVNERAVLARYTMIY
jgi:hypothetical protein